MASYLIKYLDGEDEVVQAETLERFGDQYIGFTDGASVAFIPRGNVRSIVRQDASDERGE
ncbi:hypothetical protein OHA37_27000 [Streptomyces sp. NBC_00335]|uniref:hypothetical protein n=1 Tax=unclassified Streptomyces TaxID=2593676 RepID=UPI0022550771|nr:MULTISPECIES: hypothetical protein [unclassified Streptomyces]MCX5407499.1 hypothetical protein [Streptomyces sp. NBC_00086]